jgi:hypothetical protein
LQLTASRLKRPKCGKGNQSKEGGNETKVLCAALWMGAVIGNWAVAAPATVKLTGWFACDKCTAARVAKGDLRPSNPECAKTCIEHGDPAVFLSEQGKESLKVRNYKGITDDLGFHVEVTGVIDAAAKTITIESVKQLSYEGASCARPRKDAK